MEEKKAVADNYECANKLEHFKQKFLDPLKERLDKNHDFIFKGGYEKQCKEKKVDPDPKQIERMKKAYDEKVAILNPCKMMYNAVIKMVMKHEAVVNELVKIHVGIRDNIFWKGEMPPKLMPEQQQMMEEYYRALSKIVATCKLDES